MSTPPVYIIDGARSPFLKARGIPGPFSAADLAVQTGRQLLLRQPFKPTHLSEVILGCAAPAPDEMNIARLAALRLGCGHSVPAYTVMRNCASGLQAIDSAVQSLQAGRSSLVLAGGVDALSRAPVLFHPRFVQWLAQWRQRSGITSRIGMLAQFRPHFLRPIIGLLKGLTDPVAGLGMGQTAENLATQFNIDRNAMDAFSLRSHARAHAAHDTLTQAEIVPLFDDRGQVFEHDNGVRADSSLGTLAALKPAFDKPWGNVTAGNSSQVSDGAALLILANQQAVDNYRLQPLARIIDTRWAALDPALMGLGPVYASTALLAAQGLGLADIAHWEINEAFAAQVLACLAALNDTDWCQTALGTPAWGDIPPERLNPHGGAIAVGHPVGASGARLVLHLAHSLSGTPGALGLASLCVGGGQGGAMLIQSCARPS